jgi:hypothetical protein
MAALEAEISSSSNSASLTRPSGPAEASKRARFITLRRSVIERDLADAT